MIQAETRPQRRVFVVWGRDAVFSANYLDNVQATHHTHVWSLDGEHHVLTTHVVVDDETTKEEILRIKRAVIALADNLDCEHVTVEIEYASEDCRMREHE